jgi:hypothetical protein
MVLDADYDQKGLVKMAPKALPHITLCFSALYAWYYMCNNYGKQKTYIEFDDDDRQEVIVVSKTPRGAWAEGNDPNEFYGIGWYNIGLSRSGKEPIEYIWRVGNESYDYALRNAEIGDKGIIHLEWWAKQNNIKLPQPNAEKPTSIMSHEVYWINQKQEEHL